MTGETKTGDIGAGTGLEMAKTTRGFPTRNQHLLQGRHGALSLPLLREAETGIEHHDSENGDGVARFADDQGQAGGDRQDGDQHTGELAQQNQVPGVLARHIQTVVAETLVALVGFGAAEAASRINGQEFGDRFGR